MKNILKKLAKMLLLVCTMVFIPLNGVYVQLANEKVQFESPFSRLMKVVQNSCRCSLN